MYLPILQMERLRLQDVRLLAQGCSDQKSDPEPENQTSKMLHNSSHFGARLQDPSLKYAPIPSLGFLFR